MKNKASYKIRNAYREIETLGSVYGEQNFRNSTAILYHENSKLTKHSSRLLGVKVRNFNNEFFHTRASQPFKVYPGTKCESFHAIEDKKFTNEFFKTIRNRRSRRTFEDYAVSLEELYYMLQYSYGISEINKIQGVDDGRWCYRNVPSGGALYPLEIYISVFSADIKAGLYHYRPDENCMELIREGNHYPSLNKVITAEPVVDFKHACCAIFITGIFERVLIKYGDRGYRFILLEAGFVSQNISMICEAIGLGSCMIGGYQDEEINTYLGIHDYTESVLNTIIIGKPTKTS